MLCCAVAIIPKYSKCGVKLSARSCRSWRRAKLSLRPCWTTKPWFKLRLVAKSEYEGCRTNLQTFPENTVLIFLSCGLIRLLGVFMWAGQSRGTCKTIWEEMMEWMARNDSENVICFGLSFLAVIQSQHIRQRCWSWRPQIVYPVRGLDQGNQMLSKFFFFSSSSPVYHIIMPIVFLFLIWRHLGTTASIFAAVSYHEEDILFLACWGAGNGQI